MKDTSSFMRHLIWAFIVLMLLVLAANAQSCGSYSRTYSRTYHAPTTYSYAPAVSYGAPTYYSSVKTYHAPAKVYKEEYAPTYYRFILALPVANLPTYGATYSPPDCGDCGGNHNQRGSALTPPQPQPQRQPGGPDPFQEAVLKRLDSLDKKMDSMDQRLQKIERTREPIPQLNPKDKDPEKGPPPKIEPPDGDLDKAFVEINKASCLACHSRSNAKAHGGEFILSEDDGAIVTLTAEQRESIETQLMEGKMPRLNTRRAKEVGIKPLTQDTADVIFKVIDRQKRTARQKKS